MTTETEKPATALRAKAAMQVAGFAAVTALTLFAPAGTLSWWNAWVFLGVALLLIGTLTLSVHRATPGLLEERLTARERAKSWDRVLVAAIGGLPFVVNVLAGLDHRLGWTRGLSVWISVAALAPMLAGILLTYGAMKSNPFFSSHVRIQKDRGHAVISAGPYAHLRHPGYAGAILYNLGIPLLLGSLPALCASFAMALVLVIRTWLEDRTLASELPGYVDYAARVRHRLIPPIW